MFRYILQRLIYMIITIFVIATATFFLMKTLPGSPLHNQEKLNKEQIARIEAHYGLDKPIPVQYVKYMFGLVKGDLGTSFQYDDRPVTELIGDRIEASLRLGLQGLIVGTLIGLFLGIIAALRHNTAIDYFATVVAVLGVSIPSFVFAAILKLIFAVKLDWLPVAYWPEPLFKDFFTHFPASFIQLPSHFLKDLNLTVLPTVAVAVFVISTTARFIRAEMLEVLNSEYITLARAKGMSRFQVVFKHGVRNALIPVVTVLGPLAVNLLTGSLVIERIFAIPGLGEQFVRSIQLNDYPTIMGVTLLYSVMFIGVIFLIDLLYGVIDPRIRLAGRKD